MAYLFLKYYFLEFLRLINNYMFYFALADPAPRKELDAFCLVLHAHLVNSGFACLRRGANNDADGFLAHPCLPDQRSHATPSSTLHLTYCHINLQARPREQETATSLSVSSSLSCAPFDHLPRFELKLTSLFSECMVRRHILLAVQFRSISFKHYFPVFPFGTCLRSLHSMLNSNPADRPGKHPTPCSSDSGTRSIEMCRTLDAPFRSGFESRHFPYRIDLADMPTYSLLDCSKVTTSVSKRSSFLAQIPSRLPFEKRHCHSSASACRNRFVRVWCPHRQSAVQSPLFFHPPSWMRSFRF